MNSRLVNLYVKFKNKVSKSFIDTSKKRRGFAINEHRNGETMVLMNREKEKIK